MIQIYTWEVSSLKQYMLNFAHLLDNIAFSSWIHYYSFRLDETLIKYYHMKLFGKIFLIKTFLINRNQALKIHTLVPYIIFHSKYVLVSSFPVWCALSLLIKAKTLVYLLKCIRLSHVEGVVSCQSDLINVIILIAIIFTTK